MADVVDSGGVNRQEIDAGEGNAYVFQTFFSVLLLFTVLIVWFV